MEQKPLSEGRCHFCQKTFAKAGINRHLASHLTKLSVSEKPGTSFHIKVEPASYYGSTGYFLSLWMDGDASLEALDTFLQRIWLHCCGHMSAFIDPAKYPGAWGMMEEMGEIPMSRKAKKVMFKGMKLKYEYDFGSTTELVLTVMGEYPVKASGKIVLLSRNEPLKWMCEACGKNPAVELCTIHEWGEDSMFCSKCAKQHAKTCDDFADYAALPVVNSPRMGVCGYTGGTIDTERD